MGCVPVCRCQCGQLGCGCHRRGQGGTTAVATSQGAKSRCNMCGRTVPALFPRSDLGRVVTAVFCPNCDIARPR